MLSIKSLNASETIADLTEGDLRVLHASINRKPAANPAFLGQVVKSVSKEIGLNREEVRYDIIPAYVIAQFDKNVQELAANNAARYNDVRVRYGH